jgi:D-glycero-alpha-D-manno-heptose-7-phosphate kinase
MVGLSARLKSRPWPAGTGLILRQFHRALLKALLFYRRQLIHPKELAERACATSINRLAEPVGKQDQRLRRSAA